MPLLSFLPTKARLVIEDSKDSVLVMKVTVAKGETVELAGGGRLEALGGVLRVRERKASASKSDGAIGALIFINESGRGADFAPAKFQINLGMAPDKFEPLLRVALSGRLPEKFFVDAGERVSAGETRGMSYGLRGDNRTKIWDTVTFRTLPVTNFAMILPIDVPGVRESSATIADPYPVASMATNAQVAELVDDLLVFQSETRNVLYAMVATIAVVVLLALVFGLILLTR
jgi:hypothetical protein